MCNLYHEILLSKKSDAKIIIFPIKCLFSYYSYKKNILVLK